MEDAANVIRVRVREQDVRHLHDRWGASPDIHTELCLGNVNTRLCPSNGKDIHVVASEVKGLHYLLRYVMRPFVRS